MKTLRYRGGSHRREFSAADLIKMGGSESSKPVSVDRGGNLEVTNVVGEYLLKHDPRSWREVASDDSDAEVASEPEPVSDTPVEPESGDVKTEATPGDAPETAEGETTSKVRRPRSGQ